MSIPADRVQPKGLPRNVWAVTLTSFFTDLANEMMIALIPLYLTGVLGAQPSIVGLVEVLPRPRPAS